MKKSAISQFIIQPAIQALAATCFIFSAPVMAQGQADIAPSVFTPTSTCQSSPSQLEVNLFATSGKAGDVTLVIRRPSQSKSARLFVYNNQNELIHQARYTDTSLLQHLSFAGLPEGNYVFQVQSGRQHFVKTLAINGHAPQVQAINESLAAGK